MSAGQPSSDSLPGPAGSTLKPAHSHKLVLAIGKASVPLHSVCEWPHTMGAGFPQSPRSEPKEDAVRPFMT